VKRAVRPAGSRHTRPATGGSLDNPSRRFEGNRDRGAEEEFVNPAGLLRHGGRDASQLRRQEPRGLPARTDNSRNRTRRGRHRGSAHTNRESLVLPELKLQIKRVAPASVQFGNVEAQSVARVLDLRAEAMDVTDRFLVRPGPGLLRG